MTNSIATISSPALLEANVIHGFSTRGGGVSTGGCAGLNFGTATGDLTTAVDENFRRLFAVLGAADRRLGTVQQVHGDGIAEVYDETSLELNVEADAIVTRSDRWLIGIKTADCVPILIAGKNIVAAVHAGWRGTAKAIAAKTVAHMVERTSQDPSEFWAGIGPAIGSECYDVGSDVGLELRAALAQKGVTEAGVMVELACNHYRIDLKEANRRLLLSAGLAPKRISLSPLCVACDATRFYSHRRDKGETGRMFNFIGLKRTTAW